MHAMKHKIGGVEAWKWAAMVAGLAAIYYVYKARKANTAASATAATPAPYIDPTTGLPYNSATPPGGTAGGSTTSTATTPAQEIADVTGLISALQPLFPAPAAPANPAPQYLSIPPGTTVVDPNGNIFSTPGVGPAGARGRPGTPATPFHGTHPAPSVRYGKGWISAPYGHNKPVAKKGYTVRGTGNGTWAYVPA